VIRGARLVDGTGSPARPATVVIRGSRIEAVVPAGDAPPVPPQARVIDAAGQTLLPGLFDLHTHLAAAGVAGVPGDLNCQERPRAWYGWNWINVRFY
jgi:cytosine/adenosine deaminase-related metal-dependent hydrolase